MNTTPCTVAALVGAALLAAGCASAPPAGDMSPKGATPTTASANQAVRQVVARKMLVLGLQRFGRAELEAVQAAGQALEIRVLGLASIDDDVPPALAQATIASVTVLGAFHASAGVKAALAGRMH